MMAETALKKLTVEEFFDWCPDDDTHWELFDGVPVAMAPTKSAHRILAANLGAMLHRALSKKPECRVETPGGVAKGAYSYYEPDLLVSCGPVSPEERVTRNAVMIVEILSPSTERTDRRIKTPDYRDMPSVRELLLIDPSTVYCEVHRRQDGEVWVVEFLRSPADRLHLDSAALDVALVEVYEKVPLDEAEDG
jgi:Uma2 family endonuclease